ncbi:MAG: hypothetical protein NTW96_26185, partial [Planctomycetia bacterium]|nr:hypothetical protein [Planctomycetia bacterium]
MATEVVGRLRTDLILNAGQFIAGINKAKVETISFSKTIMSAAASMKGLLAIGIGGWGIHKAIGAIKEQFDAIEQMAHTAESLGMSVEVFSKLGHAANMGGVGVENLSAALGKVQVAVSEGATAGGEAAKAFADIGLSAEAMNDLSADQNLLLIADGLQKVKLASDRLRLAKGIAGKGAGELVPWLMGGGDAIRAQMANADRIGASLETLDVDKIKEAHVALRQLSDAWKGVKSDIAITASPVLTAVFDGMTEAIVACGLKTINLAEAWSEVAAGIDLANAKLYTYAGGVAKMGGVMAQGAQSAVDWFANNAGTNQPAGTKDLANVLGGASRLLSGVGLGFDVLAGQKTVSAMSRMEGLGNLRAEMLRKKTRIPATENVFVGAAPTLDEKVFEKMLKDSDQFQAKMREDAGRVFEGTMTPFEKYRKQVADVQSLFDVGALGLGPEAA